MQLLRKCTRGQRFVVVLMYGRLEWVECDGGGGGVWLQVEEEGEGEERSVLCGHGWCVWEGGGEKNEEGREREGRGI